MSTAAGRSATPVPAGAGAGAGARTSDRAVPAHRSVRPPAAWLVAPLVVGLLAAGGLLWVRHRDRPAPWCGRIGPVLDAASDLERSGEDPEVLTELASAVDDLDLAALVAELPADLGPGIGSRAALWPDLGRQAASAAPGATFLQVVPFPLVSDLTTLRTRYERECTRL